MALSKKEKIFLGIGAVAAIGAFLGFKRGTVNFEAPQSEDLKQSLLDIAGMYGTDYAKDIERVIRLETANMKSKQWKVGNSAGMEAIKNSFPYGWSSLAEYSQLAGLSSELFDTYVMTENGTGVQKTFIAFPSPGYFVDFLAWFIAEKRDGDVTKWYSLNDQARANYRAALNNVSTGFVI